MREGGRCRRGPTGHRDRALVTAPELGVGIQQRGPARRAWGQPATVSPHRDRPTPGFRGAYTTVLNPAPAVHPRWTTSPEPSQTRSPSSGPAHAGLGGLSPSPPLTLHARWLLSAAGFPRRPLASSPDRSKCRPSLALRPAGTAAHEEGNLTSPHGGDLPEPMTPSSPNGLVSFPLPTATFSKPQDPARRARLPPPVQSPDLLLHLLWDFS